ncbi:MAG: PAS domain-containing protein, partial [Bacteroidota bacterium]
MLAELDVADALLAPLALAEPPLVVPSASTLVASLRGDEPSAVIIADLDEAVSAVTAIRANAPDTPAVVISDRPIMGMPTVLPDGLAGWIQALRPLPAWDPIVPTDSLDNFARHLPIGVYRSTPDGRILYANAALAQVLGAESVDALHSIDVRRDLGYPRDHFADEIQRSGTVHNLVVWWRDRAGRELYTRENGRIVYDANGDVLYYERS